MDGLTSNCEDSMGGILKYDRFNGWILKWDPFHSSFCSLFLVLCFSQVESFPYARIASTGLQNLSRCTRELPLIILFSWIAPLMLIEGFLFILLFLSFPVCRCHGLLLTGWNRRWKEGACYWNNRHHEAVHMGQAIGNMGESFWHPRGTQKWTAYGGVSFAVQEEIQESHVEILPHCSWLVVIFLNSNLVLMSEVC